MRITIDTDWFAFIQDLPKDEQYEVLCGIVGFPAPCNAKSNAWKKINELLQLQEEKKRIAKMKMAQKKREYWAKKKNAEYVAEQPAPDPIPEPAPVPVEVVTEEKNIPEVENPFLNLTENPEIIQALKNPESELCLFLSTGQGYDDALTKDERAFVDRVDVRSHCLWCKTPEPKPKKGINLDFCSTIEEIDLCKEWLDYKANRRETYKDKKSVQLWLNKLRKFGNNDPVKMRAIIEQSMANNWAGIFELKADPTPNRNRTKSDIATEKTFAAYAKFLKGDNDDGKENFSNGTRVCTPVMPSA